MVAPGSTILLSVYKRILSPLLHAVTGNLGACRFQPTCSEYAVIAISTRGLFGGSLLALRRLLRCNPLGAGGFDPVPGTYVYGTHVDADPQQDAALIKSHSCIVALRQLP